MKYSKGKAREHRTCLAEAEKNVKQYELICDNDPQQNNLNNLEVVKQEYELLHDYIQLCVDALCVLESTGMRTARKTRNTFQIWKKQDAVKLLYPDFMIPQEKLQSIPDLQLTSSEIAIKRYIATTTPKKVKNLLRTFQAPSTRRRL